MSSGKGWTGEIFWPGQKPILSYLERADPNADISMLSAVTADYNPAATVLLPGFLTGEMFSGLRCNSPSARPFPCLPTSAAPPLNAGFVLCAWFPLLPLELEGTHIGAVEESKHPISAGKGMDLRRSLIFEK